MSAASQHKAGPPWITLAFITVMTGLIALAILAARPAPPVERSAFGFDGLARWLTAQGVPARRADGGGPVSLEGAGLRVLPLYDTDPTRRRTVFDDGFDPDLNPDVREIQAWAVLEKLRQAPTVIVLPKWRDGVRRQGVRHEALLINAGANAPVSVLEVEQDAAPDEGAEREAEPAAQAGAPEPGRTVRLPRLSAVEGDVRTTQTIPVPGRFGGQVRLAAPQFAEAGPACDAIVGDDARGLVFRCAGQGRAFWVVSDPDLLNNHGLTHDDNQAFSTALMEHLRAEAAGLEGFGDEGTPGETIVIDYTSHTWVVNGAPRGRQLSDLLRYVQPPFVWLWLASALLFAAALWRGAVRERPILQAFTHGYGSARRIAFQAQARLMRATGRDGALLRVLAEARTARLCELLIGQGEGASADRLIAQLRRRDPSLGERLERILKAIAALPDRLPAETAGQALRDLETVYQEACAFAGVETPP